MSTCPNVWNWTYVTSQIFAAFSLLQGFETREYSFGLSGRSADSSRFLVTTVRSVVILVYYTILVCVWCLQGHVVLTDFGLCKEGVEPEGTTSTFCGTPEVSGLWFSPEAFLVYTLVMQFGSLTLCLSLRSIWRRRFFVRSLMTGPWTGGVWELCSMRWSTVSYVWWNSETVYCRLLHIKRHPTVWFVATKLN